MTSLSLVSLRTRSCLLLGMLAGTLPATAAESVKLNSPDGRLEVTAGPSEVGAFTYALNATGTPLIHGSPLGIDFSKGGPLPGSGWTVARSIPRKVSGKWQPLWGKRASVPDRYHEMTWKLAGSDRTPFDRATVTLRVYDDGIAFRIGIPADAKGGEVAGAVDLTEYRFAGDYTSWGYNGETHNHGPEKLSAIRQTRPPVIVVQADEDAFLALHEADLRGGEPLQLAKAGPTTLRASARLGAIAPGYLGPWRVIFCGRSPGTLVDSHLLELLNPDPQGDFSWVKPGMAVWDWRINGAQAGDFTYRMDYPSWVRMVDFAAENKIPHLVLDANWYGPEFKHDSDPLKGDKAVDVRKLIAKAKEKDVGVWLYLNDVGGRKYPLEQTLAQYGSWGAAGVKYGFMSGTPEEKNHLTQRITELCAKNRLLIDFHDKPVHPYGQVRTWPNAVTREFCHAQLDARSIFQPKTYVTSVFVNMIAGPIDMNNGMFDLRQGPTTRVDNPMAVPSTLVSEAARTLITYSGVTILPDIPEYYRKYPDLLRFIAAQQQPWRESITLSGVIGEHIIMARQSATGAWLVGAATNESARELTIPLHFLSAGDWSATITMDAADAHYLHNRETRVTEQRKLTATDTIRVKLAPGGGTCILLEAANANPPANR